jgi:hypothetical protein
MRIMNVMVAGLLVAGAQVAAAKGLDSLSQNNPENAPETGKDGEKAEKAEKSEGGEKAEAPKPPSAASKAIAGNLALSTSFGWVKASRSEGTWRTSGMSDFLVAYKVATLNPQMSIAGTYRYAPIGMSGELKGQSYRGVWEAHNFGGLLHYGVNETMSAVGSAEIGYVASHVHSLDGLKASDDAKKGGALVSVGGGGDIAIGEKNTCSVGPRLRVGFGSFTAFQLAGAFNFLF